MTTNPEPIRTKQQKRTAKIWTQKPKNNWEHKNHPKHLEPLELNRAKLWKQTPQKQLNTLEEFLQTQTLLFKISTLWGWNLRKGTT